MKLTLTYLATLVAYATLQINAVPISETQYKNISNRGLREDLDDFLELIPEQQIADLFYQYLAEDEDFGEALDYVMSDEFKFLITEVESMSEVIELLNFLQQSRLDAYEFINKINDILGIEHISPIYRLRSGKISDGLPGFIQDVKALLPIKEIKKLYDDKLQSSDDFAKLVKQLSSDEFQGLVDKLMANPTLQDLMKRAEAKGVDVQAILDVIASLLGLKFPSRPVMFATRNLKDDLNDFLRLIPQQQIFDLFYQYLSEDEDFGEALDYVLSDEFKSLITEVESMSEVINLLNFLQQSGLDAYGFINKINDILGIEHISPIYRLRSSKISGGLPGFIQDVKALLPIEEIKKLYDDKLQSSDDFAKLVKQLSSDEFQGLVDKLMANPTLQDLMKRAEAKGVDVQAILDVIASLLGLKFPSRPVMFATRNLKDDLNDFLRLIPQQQIIDLFYQYLAEDEDFGEALDYVLSDEFKSLITEVESMSEVTKLLNFLQQSGLDAYGFINKINDILGIEYISPIYRLRSGKISGGLPGFIQDVKSLLPIKEIKKLYDDKLRSSDDFAKLVKQLSSDEFQGLVDKLMANPTLQDLMKRAEVKGVDVQAILDVIAYLLGLKFPARPFFFYKEEEVIDILRVIWSKIPLDDILDTMVIYLVEDDDFQRVVKFMMKDEFKNTVDDIEELQEIKDLLKYFNEVGMDIYKWVNNFHEIIGLKKTLPFFNNYAKITGGVPGLIKDIRSLLPLKELYTYYDEKLETSSKFKQFVQRLESKELQNAVDALNKHAGFNVLLNKLENLGVDWDRVTEIISAITGIRFPQRPF